MSIVVVPPPFVIVVMPVSAGPRVRMRSVPASVIIMFELGVGDESPLIWTLVAVPATRLAPTPVAVTDTTPPAASQLAPPAPSAVGTRPAVGGMGAPVLVFR